MKKIYTSKKILSLVLAVAMMISASSLAILVSAADDSEGISIKFVANDDYDTGYGLISQDEFDTEAVEFAALPQDFDSSELEDSTYYFIFGTAEEVVDPDVTTTTEDPDVTTTTEDPDVTTTTEDPDVTTTTEEDGEASVEETTLEGLPVAIITIDNGTVSYQQGIVVDGEVVADDDTTEEISEDVEIDANGIVTDEDDTTVTDTTVTDTTVTDTTVTDTTVTDTTVTDTTVTDTTVTDTTAPIIDNLDVSLKIGSSTAILTGGVKADDAIIGIGGVSPDILLYGGRTMLPVRRISNVLGYTVKWDDAAQTVTVSNDEKTILLTIGSKTVEITDADGNTTTDELDVSAQLIGSYTYVPIRYISEALGAKVKWHDSLQMVTITTDNTKTNAYHVALAEATKDLF